MNKLVIAVLISIILLGLAWCYYAGYRKAEESGAAEIGLSCKGCTRKLFCFTACAPMNAVFNAIDEELKKT